MSALLRRLKEAVKPGPKGAVLPIKGGAVLERRKVSFDLINTAYEADPYLGSVVDSLAAQTVGVGFYTTMNADYEETTSDGKTAKDVVDEFCENVNLDDLLQIWPKK